MWMQFAFDAAVDIILEAETVYLVGVRSCEPLADFLHFYLNMIRGNIVLIKTTSVTEMFEQMIRINEKDAIIGISFPRYSMRTLKAMEFANDRNAEGDHDYGQHPFSDEPVFLLQLTGKK